MTTTTVTITNADLANECRIVAFESDTLPSGTHVRRAVCSCWMTTGWFEGASDADLMAQYLADRDGHAPQTSMRTCADCGTLIEHLPLARVCCDNCTW